MLAVYLSSHGYGHFTRAGWLVARLLERHACRLDVVAPYEASGWPARAAAAVRTWRIMPTDVGVVQLHELRVDLDATREALARRDARHDALVSDEAQRLREVTAVLGDVPPLAFDAAREAGRPAFALANFSWDWVYERMGLEAHAARAARAYESAEALFALEPGAPMPAFRRRVEVGLLSRSELPDRARLRRTLGIADDERLVLVAFRAADVCRLPPPAPKLRYARLDGGPTHRADVPARASGHSYAELLAACDLVVAKAGYGIIADCAGVGRPLLYVLRSGFPEDEVLSQWLAQHRWARRTSLADLARGDWLDAIEALTSGARQAPVAPRNEELKTALTMLARALA